MTVTAEDPVAASRDVVLTLFRETLQDMAIRAYMRPPDRLLLTLLHSSRVSRVLVAEPFRSLLGTMVRGGRMVALPPASGPERYLVSPQRWRRDDPASLPLVRSTYRRYDAALRRRAAQASCERPLLITTNPLVAGFAEAEWASSVVYFARDDWASSPPLQRWHPAFRRAYVEIRRRRRPVIAVSRPLLERIDPTGESLVVHNAVDPAEWRRPPAPPEWLHRLPRPWCVYAGSVDDRLDLDLVRRLASAGTVVLAGPVKHEEHIGPLRLVPSVHLPGHLPRPVVTGLIAAADVCLLTHRRTPLTEAMDPIKIYEYLAAGCPVIATDLTPVRDISPRVRRLGPGEDPVSVLREVLTWPAVDEAERLTFVDRNSWASRHVGLLHFALGGSSSSAPAGPLPLHA